MKALTTVKGQAVSGSSSPHCLHCLGAAFPGITPVSGEDFRNMYYYHDFYTAYSLNSFHWRLAVPNGASSVHTHYYYTHDPRHNLSWPYPHPSPFSLFLPVSPSSPLTAYPYLPGPLASVFFTYSYGRWKKMALCSHCSDWSYFTSLNNLCPVCDNSVPEFLTSSTRKGEGS